MGLLGRGAVAIWHDIAPEGRSAFYDWHGNEHMAERVAIPGFLRGRRYVAEAADLEFFNLYEADSLEVLSGEDYTSRLNNPTLWTKATVTHFRHVNRSLCTVARSVGAGGGGLITTVRLHLRADAVVPLWQAALAPLAKAEGVAGLHLLVADTEASSVSTAESDARGRDNAVPTHAILVEGWGDLPAFSDLCRTHLSVEVLQQFGAGGPIQSGLYRQQLTIDTVA